MVDGWLVGTLPFGLKYGRIRRGDLEIHIQKRKVIRVSGNNKKLCADIEFTLEKVPGLQVITEVGLGQSKAVADVAKKHKLGYQWHEPHFGLHLGLGAELPELQDPKMRTTGHHLDIVFASGHLSSTDRTNLLSW